MDTQLHRDFLFAEISVLQINERPIPGEPPQNVSQILTITEDKLVTGQTFEAAHLLKQAVQGEEYPTKNWDAIHACCSPCMWVPRFSIVASTSLNREQKAAL